MGLEMVTDNNDVGTGSIGSVHCLGGTNTTTHDKGDGGIFSHLANDVR